jgi:predicted small secreted protein
MKRAILSFAIISSSFMLGACNMTGDAGSVDIITEMPSDAAEKKAIGPEGSFCLESKGHWNKKEQHCLITEALCAQVGDWVGKSCVLPVTDCIEEGSRKEGSKCAVEYYSKEHMQTIMGSSTPQ